MQTINTVTNKLRSILEQSSTPLIHLPSIVVVGEQSSGKSSVLENLVGKDFLPRGNGIVTRRPLILQLSSVPQQKNQPITYAYFGNSEKERIHSLSKVKKEIEFKTEKIAPGKNISSHRLVLNIVSSDAPELTLIDLPGLTQVSVEGQDKNISEKIRNLVLSYIKSPKTIILAIIPANQDLANSAALKIAKEVDPKGERTLGVLTKVDLMQKGTNVLTEILEGGIHPLKLGYIPIINRSQQDILNNKKIQTSLFEEEEFFKNKYPKYCTRCGTKYLKKQLSKLLFAHLKKCLPGIKNNINDKIKFYKQKEIQFQSKYGKFNEMENKGGILMQKLNIFSNAYIESIEGTKNDLSVKHLTGGSRLHYLFTKVFGSYINNFDPLEGITLENIRLLIRNSLGLNFNLQISDQNFKKILMEQILKLKRPSIQLIELSYKELIKIIENLNLQEIDQYPKLKTCLTDLSTDLLNKLKTKTQEYVTSIIDVEADVVTLNHPDYKYPSRNEIENLILNSETDKNINNNKVNEKQKTWNIFSWFGKDDKIEEKNVENSSYHLKEINFNIKLPKTISTNEKVNIIYILESLTNYFQIIKIKILDLIPKAIVFFLINSSKEKLLNVFVTELYKKQNFDSLLAQDQKVIKERLQIKNNISVLNDAKIYLNNLKNQNLN
ncbi:dynamin related protein 1 isoform a [Anaeramoeba flamelloides]|uniref:Dynamin related protein 1 isoform a n=1 Tax=Anaeramoeba flamelloides TaxID=1746091 RepID=A0AAV7ZHR3_9EUKA|nr:dynamin related protein 1 isoform a [Anaeramoeba flamelloides]